MAGAEGTDVRCGCVFKVASPGLARGVDVGVIDGDASGDAKGWGGSLGRGAVRLLWWGHSGRAFGLRERPGLEMELPVTTSPRPRSGGHPASPQEGGLSYCQTTRGVEVLHVGLTLRCDHTVLPLECLAVTVGEIVLPPTWHCPQRP